MPVAVAAKTPLVNGTELWKQLVVGQEDAIDVIAPYIDVSQSGLAPEGRPLGVVLMLGPTGTGKTRTVEALAEVLHGSSKNLLKVDCGEFQMEHEVAKLIGAPPGYLGHRETQPMLSQAKVNGVSSENSDISIILLDEIEKAAPSMTRLLLGILDKASLRLGDNSTVNFERCLIFMTSNLGARELQRLHHPELGFESMVPQPATSNSRIHDVGGAAVKKRFSPEFMNRVDEIVVFKALDRAAIREIIKQQEADFQHRLNSRLGLRAFKVNFSADAVEWLADNGISAEYGARHLKRLIQRKIISPIASRVAHAEIPPGSTIEVIVNKEGKGLTFCALGERPRYAA